jgi:2-polyprenyl-3-methyl-5-hydroxy-6-metoxy-1,4-benzoquinol methylase
MSVHSSLERINPLDQSDQTIAGAESLQLHLERYHFAGVHIVPGTVADLACGVGYGSHLLATEYTEMAELIHAMDADNDAIAFAQQHYAHSKVTFTCGDIFAFAPTQEINNVISLETLEHLPNPHHFVKHIAAYMPKGGRFIASAPVTPSMDANPYHLQDFTAKSFRAMFEDAGFVELKHMIQVQPYSA